MTRIKKIEGSGRLFLKEIDIKDIIYCKVGPCNKTASRLYLPAEYKGKYVYVITAEEGK